eukprot:NODE_4665_length_762_cov_59.557480_g4642_i0.p1 GENE.NODE_4665_length_762_cov_59.557480_g4642_i0~~NODE_4665_length_762_cov_59.557480_g4642_i0.p1  ORF type:complete len:184 (+),score=38.57 NODE_4665_length_762_cov_59.557480_g4642_i0:83-634(+)
MPPSPRKKSPEKKLSKKERKKLQKQQELMQKMEEEKARDQEDFFKQEATSRQQLDLEERLELAEMKLEKNRQYMQQMVERKTHTQLQQRYQDLSRSAASEKAGLEKTIAGLDRTKEMLTNELSELKDAYTAQAEELAAERKKLEAEMSERGNCFVCPDCSKNVVKIIRKTSLAATLLRREGLA